jgi:uncharacterized protein (DUF433 family)
MREIVHTEDVLGGDPRIDGTRVGVIHVKERLDVGDEPAQVAADYGLDLADVYRALAYYYDNPDEMDEIERRRADFVDDLDSRQPDAPERA